MITNRNPRSYEVSIWTLQDGFITVLKQTNLEHKGLIEEAKMSLKDDSEDTFSFRIPMYIHRNGQRIENPLWYNTTNGNLIANLRKLKVIFNKGKQDKQRIFEFLITKVTESHQGFETYCEVESEGLAFNELGKTGYKIDLSEDLYLMEYNDWKDKNPTLEETEANGCPINNINYWVNKVIPSDGSLGWIVEYNMDWSDFIMGNDNIDQLNSIKIYEEAYNENWKINDSGLIAPAENSLISTKEKLRMVTANDSNRYNLTQIIAETFGVYCRYIYEYDDNFYITGRKIQFYNSGLKDKTEDIIDFNYYYDTEDISREMDSADQITKMIVLSNNSDADLIDSSITNVSANKSLEDYLLNFDYLYNIGAITKEQYEEVPKFEAKMRQHNEKLMAYSNAIQICEEKLIEARAEYENMRVMCDEDNERLQEEQNYIKHILNAEKTDYDSDPTTLSMTGYNPDNCVIYTNSQTQIRECYFKWESVIYDTNHPIILFTSLAAANEYGRTNDLNELDTKNYIKFDSSNTEGIELIKDKQTQLIIGIKNVPTNFTFALFAVYSYSPDTYHKILAEIWGKKYKEDKEKLPGLKAIVDNLHGKRKRIDDFDSDYVNQDKKGLLYNLQVLYDEELEAKNQDILKFEKMMGPALREGTWQPEDTYAKYGDKKSLSNLDLNSNSSPEIFWDNILFDGEDKNYYKEGSNLNRVYYPCIDLSGLMNLFTLTNLEDINEDRDKKKHPNLITISDLGFVWDDNTVPGMAAHIIAYNESVEEHNKNKKENEESWEKIPEDQIFNFPYILNIGSNAQLAFLKYVKSNNESENEDENEEKKYNEGDIIPVLMLTGAEDYIVPEVEETLTDALIKLNGSIGYITNNIKNEKIKSDEDQDQSETITKNVRAYIKITSEALTWINDDELANFETVYPRIKISSYNFKNNTDNYSLYVNQEGKSELLSPYFSYDILNRYDYKEGAIDWAKLTTDKLNLVDTDFSYYINIKPEVLFNYYSDNYPLFTFNYELSNTGLAIYLDALKIMKENAWPKVTYNITPKIIKTNFMETAYDSIHTLIHINDYDLKFENVMGYISGIDLDLDKPWEDSIEIKNYKTKFEDLFTSIVASTAQMQKNSTVINALSSVITTNGQIAPESLQSSILGNNLQLAYTQGNNGTFTIEDKRILAESSSGGAVVYTASGIFTATEKDNEGNYIWNTGILPSGISANAITSGRIDTNLINIYSDNNLRLQLNKDGLFAYKSWFSDGGDLPQDKLEEINKREGMDPSQYVVHNSEGLFLIAKEGAMPEYQAIKYATKEDNNNNKPLIINVNGKDYELNKWPVIKQDGTFDFTNERYTALTQDVNRVEISWNGLKLRNWNNDVTFYADPNTGDLVLGGTLIEGSTYLTVPKEIIKQLYEKQNPEDNGAGEDENTVVNNNNKPQTFVDHIIDAINTNKDIRYLRSDIIAVKASDYWDWKATSISEKILYDALEAEDGINNRLQDVKDTLQNFINDDYKPILSSLTNMVNGSSISSEENFPENPQKYQAVKLTTDKKIGNETYLANHTYWWDEESWVELLNRNINLSTNQELNLFGANATFAAGSELKMLAGGKLHLFGGEIWIASQEDVENGIQTDNGKITTPVTNGIVMDDNGLAIYSTKNITIGTKSNAKAYYSNETIGENTKPSHDFTIGLELNGDNGSFTVVTDTATNAQYENAGIKFYNLTTENGNKILNNAITLDGNGINIATGAKIDIESTNFKVHSVPVDNQPIFYIGDDIGQYIAYRETNNVGKLVIKGDITADSLTINNGQAIESVIDNLQNQINGEIDTWFYQGAPSASTLPESKWTTATEKDRHIGDLYYDISPSGDTAGRVWRYIQDPTDNTYKWDEIHDTATTAALAAAAAAQLKANEIHDGTQGLEWKNSNNETTINKNGISIYGNGGYFKVDSNKLGFYKIQNNVDEALLYYANGNVYLKGNIYLGGHFYTIDNNGNVAIESNTIEQHFSSLATNKAGDVLTAALGTNGNITTKINNTINSLRNGYTGTLDQLNSSISSISSNLPQQLANTLPTIFNEQPTNYKVGDIWYKQVDNYKHKYVCIQTSDTYNANHWVATDGGQIQSSGLKIDAEANIVSIYAGGSINILTESNSASNNVTLNKNGITMFTNSMFSAIGNAVVIATNGSKTQPLDNYIWMRTPTGENPRLDIKTAGNIEIASGGNMTIASGGNMTIAAGGNMTIGAASGTAATLSLLSTGKLIAYGAKEVIIATGDESNKGSYLWMYENNNQKVLDIGTTGNFQIFANGKFSAFAAQEVLIASLYYKNTNTNTVITDTSIKPDNSNVEGSYLWMHTKNSKQVLDIGTTGSFNLHSGNFIIDSTATDQNPLLQILKYKDDNDKSKGLLGGLQFLANGTLNITGTINAVGGMIGGWNISQTALKRNFTSLGIDEQGNNIYPSGYIYIGEEGIKFGDALKFEPAVPGTDENGNQGIGDNGNNDNDRYILTLNNVNFSNDLLNQLSDLGNIPKTTAPLNTENGNILPVFDNDSDIPNGTLGVYYTDGIQTTNTFNCNIDQRNAVPSINYIVSNNTDKNFHNITLKRWNVYNDVKNTTYYTNSYCRVGTAHTASNKSGIRVRLYNSPGITTTIPAGTVLTINFTYKDRQGGYDQINQNGSYTRAGKHVFKLYSGDTLIGQTSFTHPYYNQKVTSSTTIKTATRTSIQLITTQEVTVGDSSSNNFELIVYCNTTISLIFIQINTMTITGTAQTQSNNKYGLFLKSAGIWNLIGGNLNSSSNS